MATQKSTTFHVALDGLKLSAAQRANVTKAINAATLHELAMLDLAGGLQARIPAHWPGLWIIKGKLAAGLTVPDTSPALPAGVDAGSVASVQLNGISLNAGQQRSLERSIRSAALGELGRIGPNQGVSVTYPKEWKGIWIGPGGQI